MNNLKGVDVKFPLNVFTVVTGVSGSGKSSLVKGILYPALKRHLDEVADTPGEYSSLGGDWKQIKHVEFVDQNPIGKSTRSNPATYVKHTTKSESYLLTSSYQSRWALHHSISHSTLRGDAAKNVRVQVSLQWRCSLWQTLS